MIQIMIGKKIHGGKGLQLDIVRNFFMESLLNGPAMGSM